MNLIMRDKRSEYFALLLKRYLYTHDVHINNKVCLKTQKIRRA